LEPDLLLYE
jgi:hypothetical protein